MTLPHSRECEQAILGGMLLNKEAADYALDELSPSDFFTDRCRNTFSAMGAISRDGRPIDWLTITQELQDLGNLETVGGVPFLTELSNCVPSAANIAHYVGVVRQKSVLRRLIAAGNEIVSRASHPVDDLDGLLSDSERMITEIGSITTQGTAVHSSGVVGGAYSAVMDAYEKGGSITGLTTGFRLVDAATAGLQPKDFVVLMARPSMGKTALALTLAMNQARRGHHVGILSLEMSCDQLGMRMLSAEAKVNLKTLRRGMLSQSDWDRVTEAEARITEWPIWIDEEAGLTSGRISSKARRMDKEHGLEVLYIDHVHLVRGDRGASSREREMALISGNLKSLAKELNIPVVALAQLNRKCEERTNKRPQLADLRDSGALEQDADCVFGLYRDHHYNDGADPNEAEFIINKQRNGEVGKIPLRWIPEWTTFMDAEVNRR